MWILNSHKINANLFFVVAILPKKLDNEHFKSKYISSVTIKHLKCWAYWILINGFDWLILCKVCSNNNNIIYIFSNIFMFGMYEFDVVQILINFKWIWNSFSNYTYGICCGWHSCHLYICFLYIVHWFNGIIFIFS